MKKNLHFFNVFLLCSFIVMSHLTYSQKEANIWYFGTNAGVDFNSGSPVALTDGALVTQEGCASIADKFGSLLFYSDGLKVWNKVHAVMPNGSGLKGDGSSSQAAVIVPKPGSTTIYYVFTVDQSGMSDGLQYSEVDMTLDGGKGDVTAIKNVPLVTPVSEKITAVLHSNKKDIWVISVNHTTGKFYSFLVTSAGVSGSPVTSIAGTFPQDYVGYLKVSADGKYLAQVQSNTNNADVLKFDNLTGMVTSWFTFPRHFAYGVEFSPDSKLLYISCWGESKIFQYNLGLPTPSDIIASETPIGPISGSTGAIQLGPDQKIYITKASTNFLGCIPNPDILGVGCGFIDNAVSLSGKSGTYGLPNFIQSFFSISPFTYTNICFGTPTNFLIQDSISLTSVDWDFGDPASGPANTSSFYNPYHFFTSVGTYTVKAIVTPADTLIGIITIKDLPFANLGRDTSYCTGSIINLSTPAGQPTYLWNTAATTNSINVSSAGKYWVRVTNECGVAPDTILVTELHKPSFNLGNDTIFCDGDVLNLQVRSSYSVSTYAWSDGSSGSSIIPTGSGKYWSTASNYCGSASDTIMIDKRFKPMFSLRKDTALCLKEIMTLSVTNTYTNYLWNDGTTAPTLMTNDFGTYWLKITNECGSNSDTFHLKQLDIKPLFTLGNDTSFCFEESLTLKVKPFKSYLWDDGSRDSSRYITKEGLYSVKVWNDCGFNSDTIRVGYLYCHLIIPNVVTSNNDGVNDFFFIRGLYLGVADLKVLNRWGNPVYESKGYNNDWKPSDLNDGVYYYIMNYPPDNKTYTGFMTIFNGK